MSDLIRREDVLKAIWDWCCNREYAYTNATYWLQKRIESIPSVERKGEWKDAEIPLESGGSMPIQVCNLCKTFYPLAYTGGGHRFCPNCGARMKGADDECD